MDQITLYKHSNASISITIWAYIQDDMLVIAGQDLDKGDGKVSAVWGDSEYEYFFSLSPKDTQKLHALLIEETNIDCELLFLVSRFFSGEDVCARFQDYCQDHALEVQSYSC